MNFFPSQHLSDGCVPFFLAHETTVGGGWGAKIRNEIIIFQFRRIKSVIEKSEIYGRCCGVDLRLVQAGVWYRVAMSRAVLARINDACIGWSDVDLSFLQN